MQDLRNPSTHLFNAAICAISTGLLLGCTTSDCKEPEPTSDNTAVFDCLRSPDKHAWRIFKLLNRQAVPDRAGCPDPHHPTLNTYDDDCPVVWETFARVTSQGKLESEVFPISTAPVPWDELRRPEDSFQPPKFDSKSLCLASNPGHIFKKEVSESHVIPGSLREVRINRTAYEYICEHKLYCQETLKTLHSNVRPEAPDMPINFDSDARVLKAIWCTLDGRNRDDFHWRKAGNETYVLVALHIVTKDLDNWFWTTFLHEQYIPSTERPHVPPPPADVSRTRKWGNYRLLGTQRTFADAQGRATRLTNPKIETEDSSCITCHAYAAVNWDGWIENAPSPLDPPFGPPSLDYFWEFKGTPGKKSVELTKLKMLPTDFLWAIPESRAPGKCRDSRCP